MPPVRFTTFVIVAAAVLTTLFIFSSSSRRVVSEAAQAVTPPEILDKLPDLPKLPDVPSLSVPARFNWHNSAHKPPIQKNSTNGETSWHSDWRWLNPFSSTVTLDEDRALLPPLRERPYIYTYYDASTKKDKETKQVDQEFLLLWRRAWWAQGFRPVVLTQADATSNPMYRELAPKGMPKALEYEFSRWLAWAHMGTGLLADYYCLPMSSYDDDLLTHLRHGQFAQLTKFDGLDSGLFAGEKSQIENAIKSVLGDARLSTFKSLFDGMSPSTFRIEKAPGIAYYSTTVIQKKYPSISNAIASESDKGRRQLINLIGSHLHNNWQNSFSNGISILKPVPLHTTALISPALHLAQLLVECPPSTLPSSCPPNRPRCVPCVTAKTRLYYSPSYTNSSILFTIATIPHPYTLLALSNLTTDVSTSYIRRSTVRDAHLTSLTTQLLGTGRAAPSRLIVFKDIVASTPSRSRVLFLNPEHFPADFYSRVTSGAGSQTPSNDVQKAPEPTTPFPDSFLEELSWSFGFPISRRIASHGESINPVPLPQRWQHASNEPEEHKTSYDPPKETADELEKETALLKKTRVAVKSKNRAIAKVRDAAEKWNLADYEAWKFVRAFRAQGDMERKMYEKEEGALAGGARNGRWW